MTTDPNEPTPVKYLLWDASAVIGYYVPQAAASTAAAERVRVLVDSIRNHRADIMCFIPNVVVAEVFVALDRNHYSTWDRRVNRNFGGDRKSLHAARYRSSRMRFRKDIHNGALFYQYELNRYHILGIDLISPVDKHRKIYRKGKILSLGASDLLIGAMALHMAKVHGRDNVALVTTDRRMEAVFAKACPQVNPNTAKDLGLHEAATELGFGQWSPEIYPKVIDIARCKTSALPQWFGMWPLITKKPRNRLPKA